VLNSVRAFILRVPANAPNLQTLAEGCKEWKGVRQDEP